MLRPFLNSFVDLIYPPLCLHCRDGLRDRTQLFCEECLVHFEMIDPQERCPFCFSSSYEKEKRVCEWCQKHPPMLNGLAAAFDYLGPAATLVKKLKYGRQKEYAKLCASYLMVQFHELDWPVPDVILPVPISLTRRLQRGFNQSELIAEHLGKMLQVPVVSVFKRRSGEISQAGLNERQRTLLSHRSFYLDEEYGFHNQNVMIIDDVMTTGTTLKRCAETLCETCPETIYGLTVCRGIK